MMERDGFTFKTAKEEFENLVNTLVKKEVKDNGKPNVTATLIDQQDGKRLGKFNGRGRRGRGRDRGSTRGRGGSRGQGKRGGRNSTSNGNGIVVCYNCGKKNHISRECRNEKVTCKTCKHEGHMEKFHDQLMKVIERSKNEGTTNSEGKQL